MVILKQNLVLKISCILQLLTSLSELDSFIFFNLNLLTWKKQKLKFGYFAKLNSISFALQKLDSN